MSSRSILIAVLGLTLNGCAVYDYDDDRYDSRYYGDRGYSVQRYETYPVYPAYPVQQRYYRYDAPRHYGYREPPRYHYNGGHDDRRDRHHNDHRRHDNDRRHDKPHQARSPANYRPPQSGWNGQRPPDRNHGQQVSRPSSRPNQQLLNGGHQRSQQAHREQRGDRRYGEPGKGNRHAN